jgi:hypothetical protein
MLRKTVFAVLATAASVVAAPAFAASPVVGTWDTAVQVQDNTIKSTVTIAEAGGGYTVDIKDGPMPGAPGGPGGAAAAPMPSQISDVAVNGSTVTFKRHLTTPQGAMDLGYTLTADGSKLSGTVKSDFGDIPVTGTKQG